MIKVLFVCLGNICRSPTAHGVFEHLLADSNLADEILVDSAGTGAWHAGEPPDERAQAEARRRGIDLSKQRARKVCDIDFVEFDCILAMDQQNLKDLSAQCPESMRHKLHLFLSFGDGPEREVPDPYYGGESGFRDVFDLVENASRGLLQHLREQAS